MMLSDEFMDSLYEEFLSQLGDGKGKDAIMAVAEFMKKGIENVAEAVYEDEEKQGRSMNIDGEEYSY